MIDIHSHVLWQLDDGSQSLAMSKKMLELAWEHGTQAMVFTPHVIEGQEKPSWKQIQEKTWQLQEWLRQEKSELQVFPGAEVQMNWELLPELAEQGAYCIDGGKYILIELPMDEIPVYADSFWYELELKGIQPILAHPERYMRLMRHKEIIYKWRERGLLFQCNAGSFVGNFGKQALTNAKFLLDADMVDLIGSDAHRDQVRNPDMSQAAKVIEEWAGAQRLRQITVENPLLLLEGKKIAVREPLVCVENNKQSFWKKILAKLV